MPNPLAIDVTIGGLLHDVAIALTKPRAGHPRESSLLSARLDSRTPGEAGIDVEHDGPPLAGRRRR